MPFPDAVEGDVFQVTLRGTLFDQRMLTVLHYRLDNLEGSHTVEDVSIGLNAALADPTPGIYTKYYDCLASDYDADDTYIQRIFVQRQIYFSFPPAESGGGTTGDALPPGTSAAITKRGTLASRHHIGGVRMPAVPVTFNDAGRVSLVGEAIYESLALALKEQITLDSICVFRPIIFNRASPAISADVFDTAVQPTIRTMSRRVIGRGE